MFARLGATRELQRVEALLGAEAVPATAGSRRVVKRTFMFTDIITSTDLLEPIGDDAWNELLDWHDRELRASIAQHRGEEVLHTGDGFFAAFESAADGVDSAVDIQPAREASSGARLRTVGPHWAPCSHGHPERHELFGTGVHIAARVGAAAEREEILVSAAVPEEAEPFAIRSPRYARWI